MDSESQIRVLLIEDDAMVQEVNRQFVEKTSGFQVVGVCRSGKEGRRKIAHQKPDLVLLDVYMPDEDGLETIVKLRESEEDVDIIAVTAANDAATIQKLFRYGVFDYIVKPFTYKRLNKSLLQYKSFLERIHKNESWTQDNLDDMMAPLKNTSSINHLPKGLHEKTLKQLVSVLSEYEKALDAETIGHKVGLARVTARRYLHYLESEGKVEMSLHHGTVGRPIQKYRLLEKKEMGR
ncbi:response regulator [Texcoconibacillus texcoconensis]|uniref:Two-component system response regulator DctR n=1 Tax=Texcoconibacillus texcoconensis TaxID=1095777 RepID=A0A840QNR8_9BACI|nr:response regulator [Texcoconibacillus texcoconensis]MBB5173036.1 two-component system response regulator DctR [Texcoconibacillus texcoconensis]